MNHETLAPSNQRLDQLLRAASLEVPVRGNSLPALAENFKPGTDVYITFLPGDDPAKKINVAAAIRRAGFNPVPHLAIRFMPSVAEIEDFLAKVVGEAGVSRVLIVAGDTVRSRGPYATSLDLLKSGLLEKHGIRAVDVAGHPEGNAGLPAEALIEALAAKRDAARQAGLDFGIVTQFTFDAAPIEAWLNELSRHGFKEPIRIGLAGPANPAVLLKFALRCGIGNSIGMLQRRSATIGRLLVETGPDDIVRGLGRVLVSDAGRPVQAFHFFPFGGLAKTAAWIESTLHRLEGPWGPDGPMPRWQPPG